MSSGGGEQTVGYRYYIGMHLALCAGPVDAVLEVRAGERTAWSGSQTTSGAVTIDKPEMFGGEAREGGLVGTLDVMMGESTQVANAYLTAQQGGTQPAYRGVLGLVWRGGMFSANNPYIKPWAIKARRILQGWQGGSAWYSAKATITLPGGEQAANPAHIVYECLTNVEWGMGYSTGQIDAASFTAAADTFHTEGLGLCLAWTRQTSIETFVQLVMDHAGAVCGQDRTSGLFVLRQIRGGYSVPALPLFDPSNVLALDSYQRASTVEATNELSVTFTDVTTGRTGSVTVQNLAQINAQGGPVSSSRQYPGLPTAELATRAALRDLRSVSSPIARVRMRVNREGYSLLPGDVIRLTWPKLGITDLVLRVLTVGLGTLTDGAITVEAAEDVFGMPATTYAAQQPTG
ncbi:MAG: phage tail protein, partial [Pseudomonadota bacterium]